MWVVKCATSLFNSFCSNVAKQVARFLLPVFPYLNIHLWRMNLYDDLVHFWARFNTNEITYKEKLYLLILCKRYRVFVLLKHYTVDLSTTAIACVAGARTSRAFFLAPIYFLAPATTATLRTEESGRRGEVAVMGRCSCSITDFFSEHNKKKKT